MKNETLWYVAVALFFITAVLFKYLDWPYAQQLYRLSILAIFVLQSTHISALKKKLKEKGE